MQSWVFRVPLYRTITRARPTRPCAVFTRSEIFDVAVDLRRASPTFGRHVAVTLSESNFWQLYVPAGFAHGFEVLSDNAEVEYKCTDIYRPEEEIAVRWDDPTLGIAWPIDVPLLSERDRAAPWLRDLQPL